MEDYETHKVRRREKAEDNSVSFIMNREVVICIIAVQYSLQQEFLSPVLGTPNLLYISSRAWWLGLLDQGCALGKIKTLSDNQQVPRTRHEPAVIKYILMSLSHKAIPLSYISSAHIATYLKQEVSCVLVSSDRGTGVLSFNYNAHNDIHIKVMQVCGFEGQFLFYAACKLKIFKTGKSKGLSSLTPKRRNLKRPMRHIPPHRKKLLDKLRYICR